MAKKSSVLWRNDRRVSLWDLFLFFIPKSKKTAVSTRIATASGRTLRKPSLIWVIFVIGLCFVLSGAAGVVGLFIVAPNSAWYARLYRQAPDGVQPVMEPFVGTPTKLPDINPTPSQDSQGVTLDSQCPADAPKIDLTGGVALIGKREWINTLPVEPEEGIAICVVVPHYQAFMQAGVTYSSGIFKGQRQTGLEFLAHHYSYASVDNDSRFDELKAVLSRLENATYQGKEYADTAWIRLPGYVKPKGATKAPPMCEGPECFKPDPSLPTRTPLPMTPTPMIVTATPQPTAIYTPTPVIVDMVVVPTLNTVFTPVPQHATAQANQITRDEWLLIYENARQYQQEHCQYIDNGLHMDTLAQESEVWSRTIDLEFRNGDYGWYVRGGRHDVYVDSDAYRGNYPIYSVCGQIGGMPDTNNIDGNGTRWYPGIARKNADWPIDPETGFYKTSGGTYWAYLSGLYLGPVEPAPPPTQTYPTKSISQAVSGTGGGFDDVFVYNAGDFPTSANPRILMKTMFDGPFWIDFTSYIGHIGSGAPEFMIVDCTSQYSTQYGGYQVASQQIQTDQGPRTQNWCIVPGQ